MVAKGSGDKGKWLTYRKRWLKEVVTKGSSDLGKWWLREVVTYRSGDEGKWWLDTLCRNEQGEAVVVWVVASAAQFSCAMAKALQWKDMKWDEKSSDEMSLRWSAECEVQVWSLECRVWRAQCEVWRKCLRGVALHRGRAQVNVLGQQPCNRFAQSTHGPGWRTAHCKFYRWKRSFSTTLRQLSPRLVRGTTGKFYHLYNHITYMHILFKV